MKAIELTTNRSPSLRFNPIHFDKKNVTENSFGLSLPEDLTDEGYEFSITSNERGRCHGFFINTIFYIVWLDPEHKLIITKKHKK